MADITARKDEQHQQGVQFALLAGAEQIYEGALVEVNAAGYAVNGGDDAGAVFAGVAQESVNNAGGAAGDKEVVVRSGGIVQVKTNFSAAQTNVGDEVCLVDNQTIGLAADVAVVNDVVCGRIQKVVSSSVVRVALYPFGSKR